MFVGEGVLVGTRVGVGEEKNSLIREDALGTSHWDAIKNKAHKPTTTTPVMAMMVVCLFKLFSFAGRGPVRLPICVLADMPAISVPHRFWLGP